MWTRIRRHRDKSRWMIRVSRYYKKWKPAKKKTHHIWFDVCIFNFQVRCGKILSFDKNMKTQIPYASHIHREKKKIEAKFWRYWNVEKEFLIGWYVIYFLRIKSLEVFFFFQKCQVRAKESKSHTSRKKMEN